MFPSYLNNTRISSNSQVIPGDLVTGWILPIQTAGPYLTCLTGMSPGTETVPKSLNLLLAKPFSDPTTPYPIMNLARLSHLHNYFKQVCCLKAAKGFLIAPWLTGPKSPLPYTSALTLLPFNMAQNSAYFWLKFDVVYLFIFLSKETELSVSKELHFKGGILLIFISVLCKIPLESKCLLIVY